MPLNQRRRQREDEISTLSIGLTSNPYVLKFSRVLKEHRIKAPIPKQVVREPWNPAQPVELPIENIPVMERDLSRHHRVGLVALAMTLAVIFGWAGFVPLAGAVVVGGTFVVHSSDKKVQHKNGGVVKEIAVQDGKRVKEGDVLVRLDSNDARAQNASIVRQIDEIQLRMARLAAERDGNKAMAVPEKIFMPHEEYAKLVNAEISFFKARQATQYGVQKLAEARVAQLEQEISGYQAQFDSGKRQYDINEKELSGMKELFDKRIAPIQKLTPLQREKARLEGIGLQLKTAIESDRVKISEIKLQVKQSEENFRSDAMKDLGDASAKLGQLLEIYLVTNNALQNTDVLAPVSGVAHDVTVHAPGEVIAPGSTILTIIPVDEELEVAVRLAPDRIDQVKMGVEARVKLTAFERTTPDIRGTVKFISPDVVESRVGSYYDVRIAVDQHPHGMTLTPGMPAEVFIKTDERTMLSYLAKPLTENLARAFRER